MRKNSKSAWTQDDEKYLIDNYKQTPYAELAEKLGRSKQSVTARISLLGLDRRRRPSFVKLQKLCGCKNNRIKCRKIASGSMGKG